MSGKANYCDADWRLLCVACVAMADTCGAVQRSISRILPALRLICHTVIISILWKDKESRCRRAHLRRGPRGKQAWTYLAAIYINTQLALVAKQAHCGKRPRQVKKTKTTTGFWCFHFDPVFTAASWGKNLYTATDKMKIWRSTMWLRNRNLIDF